MSPKHLTNIIRSFSKIVRARPASFDNFAGLVADLSGEARMSVAGASRLGIGGFGKTALYSATCLS